MILPPPDLPNVPNIQPELAEFLRRLTMWASKQFTYKVPIDTAIDGVLLQSYDVLPANSKVYKLQVTDDGTATLAPMALGSTKVGDPVPVYPAGAITDLIVTIQELQERVAALEAR